MIRRPANRGYYGRVRGLAKAGLAARQDGDSAVVPLEAARRLDEAGRLLREAVVAMDRAVNDPPTADDPRGEFRIAFARRHLRNQAAAAGELIAQVTRDLVR
jgi:hypothetical protein